MERHGFINTMMDVKVVILYATSNIVHLATEQEIYEICYQDECLSYFDVKEAIPQLVTGGHLEENLPGKFRITERGRETLQFVKDTLAFPVAQRVRQAAEEFDAKMERDQVVKTYLVEGETEDVTVAMELRDPMGQLMKLDLMAPSKAQAKKMEKVFQQQAEAIYQSIMAIFLEEME